MKKKPVVVSMLLVFLSVTILSGDYDGVVLGWKRDSPEFGVEQEAKAFLSFAEVDRERMARELYITEQDIAQAFGFFDDAEEPPAEDRAPTMLLGALGGGDGWNVAKAKAEKILAEELMFARTAEKAQAVYLAAPWRSKVEKAAKAKLEGLLAQQLNAAKTVADAEFVRWTAPKGSEVWKAAIRQLARTYKMKKP